MKKLLLFLLKSISILLILIIVYIAYQEGIQAYDTYKHNKYWQNLPKGDMDIVMLDKNNEPIRGIVCNIYMHSEFESNGYEAVKTDSDGCVHIEQLPAGPLFVSIVYTQVSHLEPIIEYTAYYKVNEYDFSRGVVFLRFDDYEVKK